MTPESPLLELVDLAKTAPSGHNAQPWTIVRTQGQRLVHRSEPRRWMRMIDPTNRELLLSFGALMETIREAAPAVGYGVDPVVTDAAPSKYPAGSSPFALPAPEHPSTHYNALQP